MSNIIAFPVRPVAAVTTPWHDFRVIARDTHHQRVELRYRALSADSAHCRARREGYVHVNSVERINT